MIDLNKLAALLGDALPTGMAVGRLSVSNPDLDVTAGCGVPRLSIRRRLERGEQWVGMLTSRAKMRQVSVDQVIWGCLTDAMRTGEGGEFGLDVPLIATPEYNGRYTAPLKNALDWASRPTETVPDENISFRQGLGSAPLCRKRLEQWGASLAAEGGGV